METLQDKIVELLHDEAFINPNKCEYELADKIEKLLTTKPEPVAKLQCSDGLGAPVSLLETNNALVWAEEFEKCKKKNNWTLDDIDESLMLAWFANAFAAQEFKMSRGN